MSTHRSRELAAYTGGDQVRRLTGTTDDVKAAIARYRDSGQLEAIGRPQAVAGQPDAVTVTVRLRHSVAFTDEPVGPVQRTRPVQSAPTPRRRRRRWPYVLAAVMAALGLLIWGGYLLATWMLASIAAAAGSAGPLLALLIIGGLLLAGATGGKKACTTIIEITHKH
jgi:hypothetical protein